MNIGLLSILHNKKWDFRPDLAQTYANALRNAIELQLDNDIEKQHGYFLSKKGYQKEGKAVGANFEDKLYVGNIHRIENHLYWNDEELADDDEIINVVVVDGPVTRDGGGCSYGSKDWRDQVMYANTIPQVVGHLFIVNTPGGEAECRNDYEMMMDDCRKNNKPTVALIDGGCYSSGVNLTCRCDRVIAMNPRDGYGCIGTMAAFWTVAHDTVDQDGYRYVELVGKDCPEKNAWWREAAKGEYEKLQAELDHDTEEFHQTVRENRPLITDDMLSGKVFEAQEVIPALVDEIGDMNRAIECVFELANQTLTAARDAQPVAVPEPKEDEPEQEPGNEPEEMAHDMSNTNQPKNNNDMTQKELKAAEVAQQPAAAQEETPAVEQPAEEAPATEAPAAEEQPAADAAPAAEAAAEETQEEQPTEEAPAAEEEQPAEEAPASEEETPAEPAASAEETPAEPAAEPASQEAVEEATAELDRITETLHSAERMIEEKDATIANLKAEAEGKDNSIEQLQQTLDGARHDIETANATIAARDKSIEEKDALIAQLKGQVADLRAEVKELAGKPAPMTDANAGVPQDNGTGAAPEMQGVVRSAISDNMTLEEKRAALRKQDEELQARRTKSMRS